MPETVVRHEGEHLYANQPRTEAGQRLSDAILGYRRAERVQAERAQQAADLPATDLTALRYLVQGHRDRRDLSPKDVIVMLDTSSATVTKVLERLVARGYVTRVPHPTDRRAHHLVPTDDGIRLIDETFAAHHSAVVAVIDRLAPADADTTADVILQLTQALDDLPAAGG